MCYIYTAIFVIVRIFSAVNGSMWLWFTCCQCAKFSWLNQELFISTGEGRKRNQISVGSCSEVSFPGKVSDADIRSLNASIQAPSGLEEPCFLKRLPNGNIGKLTFTYFRVLPFVHVYVTPVISGKQYDVCSTVIYSV